MRYMAWSGMWGFCQAHPFCVFISHACLAIFKCLVSPRSPFLHIRLCLSDMTFFIYLGSLCAFLYLKPHISRSFPFPDYHSLLALIQPLRPGPRRIISFLLSAPTNNCPSLFFCWCFVCVFACLLIFTGEYFPLL